LGASFLGASFFSSFLPVSLPPFSSLAGAEAFGALAKASLHT